jgi:hypothetical protein
VAKINGGQFRLICIVIGLLTTPAPVFSSDLYAQLTKEELAKEGVMVVDEAGTEAGRRPPRLLLGLRAGAAMPYDKVLKNIGNGTSVGPLVNAEALYSLTDWMRAGMMLEWRQHSINFWGPKFGTLSVFSILPTIEVHPSSQTRENLGLESFRPYASLGAGINVPSFSNSAETASRGDSFSSTFAVRLATGFDIPITAQWAFNTELAWSRDSGTYKLNGTEADFNASSLNLLVGVRAHF